MRALRTKQNGFVVSVEILFIIAFVVLGVVIGWTTLKDAVVNELSDTAAAVDALNQSYRYAGMTSHSGTVQGTIWDDFADFCQDQGANDVPGTYGRCVDQLPPVPEE